MNTRVESKSTILTDTFVKVFKTDRINLSRIKFISLFIIASSKVQTVGFERLATAFEDKSKAESSLRRIQRFIATYSLDTDLVAL